MTLHQLAIPMTFPLTNHPQLLSTTYDLHLTRAPCGRPCFGRSHQAWLWVTDSGHVCPVGLYSSGSRRPLTCFLHGYKGLRDSAHVPSAHTVEDAGKDSVTRTASAWPRGEKGWLAGWQSVTREEVRTSQAPVVPARQVSDSRWPLHDSPVHRRLSGHALSKLCHGH